MEFLFVNSIIAVSLHLVGSLQDGDMALAALDAATAFIEEFTSRIRSRGQKAIVTFGIDTNTGLPGDYGNSTGSLILARLHGHTVERQRVVAGWLAKHELLATNTLASHR